MVRAGFEVILIVADGLGDESKDGVRIVDAGKPRGGRVGRFLRSSVAVCRRARNFKPDIYHFHDPELIPFTLPIAVLGGRVIYDIHENLPEQTTRKHYLPTIVRKPLGWLLGFIENSAVPMFAGAVTVIPEIARRFPAHKTIEVRNYPDLDEIQRGTKPFVEREANVLYLGAISETRGIREILMASSADEERNFDLVLAGRWVPTTLREELSPVIEKSGVRDLGFLGRDEVNELLGSVRAGLVTLHPEGGYDVALPVKLFEYMAAGLPVVVSDFPLWREIVERAGAGILVDPSDVDAIRLALNRIAGDPALAETMGRSGRAAVERDYSWGGQANRLADFYRRILGGKI